MPETITLPLVQYVKFVTKRCFGIELEVNKKVSLDTLVNAVRLADKEKECVGTNHYQQDAGNHYWHCKFDRSCGNNPMEGGWEVASYKASGADDLVKISEMGTVLQKAGAEVNDNCGYHIHVEIADFKPDQAACLMAYWMKLEHMILEILPKGRRKNPYCKLLSETKLVGNRYLADAATFWAKVRPTSYENSERRVALNMCNYALNTHNKRTVELRLPEGTLDPVDIKNWARMFIHFCNYCKKAKWPGNVASVTTLRDALTILGLHNEEPFFILSKGLWETKAWFLNRAIKYSNKKNLKAEAQDFLNFISPPTTAPSPMLRLFTGYDELDGEKEKPKARPKKGREKKRIILKDTIVGRIMDDDYWQPYIND